MAHVHHAFDYIELPVDDLEGAKAFYSAAFGWSRGGGPLVLLFSEDLDATVAAVEAAGGRVVQPPAPFPGGRRFTFADPSGNTLGVWAER